MIIGRVVYRSPNMVRAIRSRGLRWEGHVVRTEEDRNAFIILTGTPAGKCGLGLERGPPSLVRTIGYLLD